MSITRRPSSIDGIKRLAKEIGKTPGLKHTKALDQSSRAAGYENFAHAKRKMGEAGTGPDRKTVARSNRPRLTEFHERTREAWSIAVDTVNPAGAESVRWNSPSAIIRALQPFMGVSINHAHLPAGGGLDFLSVGSSDEIGCIEFGVDEGLSHIVKPKRLILERISEATGESFLLLELDELRRWDADENENLSSEEENSIQRRLRQREEVLEVGRGEYLPVSVWDDGYLGHDEDGNEIPLPSTARLITRWLQGKILLVCKGSMWNGTPATYDGRHNRMTAAQIRAMIEQSMEAFSS